MTRRARTRILGLIGALCAAAVLALVFLAYTRPLLMQQLGDAFWACF